MVGRQLGESWKMGDRVGESWARMGKKFEKSVEKLGGELGESV